MRIEPFHVENLEELKNQHSNMGKNSDVGWVAVEIAKQYFKQKHPDATFPEPSKSVDLYVKIGNDIQEYEIKGTADPQISWNKLKVSSKGCHDKLLKGMELIRITNVGKSNVTLHFLTHGKDFELIPEDRWAVKKASK